MNINDYISYNYGYSAYSKWPDFLFAWLDFKRRFLCDGIDIIDPTHSNFDRIQNLADRMMDLPIFKKDYDQLVTSARIFLGNSFTNVSDKYSVFINHNEIVEELYSKFIVDKKQYPLSAAKTMLRMFYQTNNTNLCGLITFLGCVFDYIIHYGNFFERFYSDEVERFTKYLTLINNNADMIFSHRGYRINYNEYAGRQKVIEARLNYHDWMSYKEPRERYIPVLIMGFNRVALPSPMLAERILKTLYGDNIKYKDKEINSVSFHNMTGDFSVYTVIGFYFDKAGKMHCKSAEHSEIIKWLEEETLDLEYIEC